MIERPNILCVVIDCARSDYWLGGKGASLTPNLDRLRRTGVTLPTAIVEQSATSPSFTTLLTGLYSPRHGVRMVLGQSLGAGVRMLTETLAALGYHTYGELTGPLIPDVGLDRGFERPRYRAPNDHLHTAWGDDLVARLRGGGYKAPWFILLHLWELHLPRQIAAPGPDGLEGAARYAAATASLDAQLGRVFEAAGEEALLIVTGDHGEKTTDEAFLPGTAVDYIRSYLGLEKARGPDLFAVAAMAGPSALHHLFAEFIVPALDRAGKQKRRPAPSFSRLRRWADRLRLLRLLPRVRPGDVFTLRRPLALTKWMHESGLLDGRKSREKVRRFLAGARPETLEEMFGRLMISSLKKNYREGHTLHVYDYLVKVPLVLRWAGRLPAGASFPKMVRQPDILPTVLDLLGAPVPEAEGLDGRSFRPLLEGRAWSAGPAFLSTGSYLAHLEIAGVRTEDRKYTYGPANPDLPEELYDLGADPGEAKNIAAARPEECARLRGLAEACLKAQGAPAASNAGGEQGWQDVESRLKALGYID